MWQKAKILTLIENEFPWMVRTEIWVTGQPTWQTGVSPVDGNGLEKGLCMQTNLLTAQGLPKIIVRAEHVELLGGPDAFCEDPPRIPFAEWSVQPQEEQQP